MIASRLILFGCFWVLAGCQNTPSTPPASSNAGQWQASTLSERTIARANGAVKQYERCLNSEALAGVRQRGDPRALADRVLKACEPRLEGIRTAYEAEGVPDAISERYMRKTRSRGAQSLMRFLQAVEARRAAQEAEQAAPN